MSVLDQDIAFFDPDKRFLNPKTGIHIEKYEKTDRNFAVPVSITAKKKQERIKPGKMSKLIEKKGKL